MSESHVAPAFVDPFGITADPERYMPRGASERALAALARSVAGSAAVTVLCGPPGIGKTLLLRVLERRVAGRMHTLYLPYSALRFEELCAWILGLLGEEPALGQRASEALLAAARLDAEAGHPLLLLIDDAHSMPSDSARQLASLASRASGALRLLVAGPDLGESEPRGDSMRWFAAFGAPAAVVVYDRRMSAAESMLFLRASIERAALTAEQREYFEGGMIERIHARAGGVPRVVQALAGEVLRRGPAALPPDVLEAMLGSEPIAVGAPAQRAPEAAATATESAETVAGPEPPPPPAPAQQPVRHPPASWTAPSAHPGAMETPPPFAAPAPQPPAPDATPLEPPRAPVPVVEAPSESQRADSTAESVAETPSESATAQRPPPERLEPPPHWSRVFLAVLALGVALVAVPLLRGAFAPSTPDGGAVAPPVMREEPAPEAPPATPEPRAPAAEPAAEAAVAPEETAPPAAPPPPTDPLVSVHVNATPWATITIDGVDMGETPLAGIRLVPGPHRFLARLPDGRVLQRTVEIGENNRHVSFE